MKTHIALALVALHLSVSIAAPQNQADVEASEQKTVVSSFIHMFITAQICLLLLAGVWWFT